MKTKSLKVIIPVTFAICIVYIFISLRPGTKEIHFIPQWTEDISRLKPIKEDDTLIPFKLSQTAGYFTPDGRIVNTLTFPWKVTVSEKYYAAYNANSSQVKFYNASGLDAGVINEYGYPFFSQGRIYVFLPHGTSFVRCDSGGKRLWCYEYYAPITAFSSTEGGCAAGYADGTVITFKPNGNVEQKYAPGGSKYPAVLGVGISQKGDLVASVSGQERQRFVISKNQDGRSKILYHEYLNTSTSEQMLVKFSNDDKRVYFGFKGGLGIVDVNKKKSSHIPFAGKIIQLEESSLDGIVLVLSRKENKYTVSAIEPFDSKAFEFSYEADSSFIQVRGSDLYIGRDNKISKVTLAKK